MTKIKNTKKGMAKKTLSMSLVVAMLATSNVPVWAAEFSDGSDVAVTSEAEAPAVDTATDAFTDEAAPEVATEETVAPATETNTENYTSDLKLTVGAWGSAVTVTGGLKNAQGNDVTTTSGTTDAITAEYTWLADGRQAAGTNATVEIDPSKAVKALDSSVAASAPATDGIKAYTPDQKDFGKTLSLMVTVKRAGTIIYQATVEGGTVGAKDISTTALNTSLSAKINNTNTTLPATNSAATLSYNGKEQKLVPTNTYTVDGTPTGADITDCIAWNYSTNGNDFTNVTGENITVVGTVEGTNDPTSPAYGYTGKTASGQYQISKFVIDEGNKSNVFKATMKTKSVQFTGAVQKFGKSDVSLSVKVSDDTTVDITNAIKDNAVISGSNGDINVNETGYTLTIPKTALDTDSDVLKNFDITGVTNPAGAVTIAATSDKYTIVARDLSTCKGVINASLNVSDLKGRDETYVKNEINKIASQIVLTGNDGKSFTYDDIKNYVNISVGTALMTAVSNGTTGVVNNAITISSVLNGTNVSNQITLPISLTTRNFNDITIKVNDGASVVGLGETADNATVLPNVVYDGTAKKLDKMTDFGLYTKTTNALSNIDSTEYAITYDDNVNAGTVKVTLTGLKSYAGCVKNFYFKIKPNSINVNTDVTLKNVTLNPDNDADASLYKTASQFKIEKELVAGKGKTTLEEGKDYTVNFYYVPGNFTIAGATEKTIKAAAGDNAVGSKLVAAITFKKGNYSEDGKTFLAKVANITHKSISNVTVTLEKDSYTYTGKEIVPNVVVKDGSSVLALDTDYTLKVKDNKNVGTATVTVVPKTGSDYDTDSSASTTFTITPAKAEDVVVTLNSSLVTDNAANYTGKQIKPTIATVTLNGVNVTTEFNTSRLVYGDNVQAGKEAGSVTLSPKAGNKNFTGTKTHKFDIKGIALTGTLKVYDSNKKAYTVTTNAVQSGSFYFRYSGSELKFADAAFTPTKPGLKEGTDYEIKYINNVEAGYGYVVAVAKGNYEGTSSTITVEDGGNTIATVNTDGKLIENGKVLATNVAAVIGFKIKSNYFTASDITVTNGVYASGLPVKPQVTVTVAGKTLTEGKDYKLNIRPQSAGDDFTYPDSVINATDGKIFYVDVEGKGGYQFDPVAGGNTFAWGIDKFNLAAANITSSGDTVTVKNGNITVDPSDYTVTKDETAGTVTVAAKEGSKNYTGSQTVKVNNIQVGAPMISSVKVVGNKATVILSGESDGASGYDYVISKANDYTTKRVDVTKNQVKTTGDFHYVQQGTYYAYCHAWTRDANGNKVFSGWSNIYPFSVTAITPSQPVITSVKAKGNTVTVTYTKAANADGYDVVLGSAAKKVNGEYRPVEYGKLVKKNIKGNVVTATFKNVKKGTYYAGLHAFKRTSEDGKKVFSQWSNVKKVTVK